MILALRTDSPQAEVYVYDETGERGRRIWQADRTLARDLLRVCEEVLVEAEGGFEQLSGVVVFEGAGSFTGLRIGATTANAIAYARSLPIVGTRGDDWLAQGRARLKNGENDRTVLPHYGAPPRITTPK